ncbi:hypothetical protein Tco_0552983 [Tanacetum coccineum]
MLQKETLLNVVGTLGWSVAEFAVLPVKVLSNGKLLGLKGFLDAVWNYYLFKTTGEVTTVNTKLLLVEEVTTASGINDAEGVNAASEEVNIAELVSTTYVISLRNLLEDIDQDSAHIVAASKVPMLKLGEFELWRIRIEQYILMTDYALWEVIKNGATLPKTQVVEGVTTVMPITSTEDKS